MKTAEKLSTIISAKKYNFLKRFSNAAISAEEKKEIEDYESYRAKQIQEAQKNKKRFEIAEKPKKFLEKIPHQQLMKDFIKTWEFEQEKKFKQSKVQKSVYEFICKYLAKDASIEKTGVTENIPSLKKGLLIIGSYGCGKTSMMMAYHKIGLKMSPDPFLRFSTISCNALVSEFEAIEHPQDKKIFFKKYSYTRVFYFDDFGTEANASNYGKKNLMKHILEERYIKKKTTFLTTNLSLEEIEQKYGCRVFDRLQEMCNIIKMNGNSYRK